MRIPQLAALLVPVVFLVGCQTVDTEYYHADGVSWSSLTTYAWLPAAHRVSGDPRSPTAEVEKAMTARIEAGLAEKGFRKVSTGVPDVWVTYHVSLDREMDVQQMKYHYGSYYQMSAHGVTSDTVTTVYDQGSVVVDMLSGKDRNLIWRGAAQAKIDSAATQADRDRIAADAVSSLFSGYPPK